MKKYLKLYLWVVMLTVALVAALAGSAASAHFTPLPPIFGGHGHASIDVSISGTFDFKEEILLAPSGFVIAGFSETNVKRVGSSSASATISPDRRRLTIKLFSGALVVTPPGCQFTIPGPFGLPPICFPFPPVTQPGSYSGTFTIFEDNRPPTLNLPSNAVIETTSSAGEVHNFSATATDDVDPSPTVFCTPPSGSTFPLGVTTVNCRATDAFGNRTNGSFRVTVSLVDTTRPTLTLPPNAVNEATSSAGAVHNFSATATDNVDPPPMVFCFPSSGSTFPLGVTTIICIATDASGNSAIGGFTKTVVDTTPPVLTVPADITGVEATGSSGATVVYPAATATDAVGVTSGPTCTPASGTFAIGATTVTCTASDAAGNVGSDVFSVTVSLPQAASDALAEGGIDPTDVPPDVLDAVIAADQLGLLEVIPSNTTADQNAVLQPNAVVVLGDGSVVSGNIEGGPSNTVVMGGNSSVSGNIIGTGISFVGGSNVEIIGNVENETNELLVGAGAQVHFSGNVGVATFIIDEGGAVAIDGNMDVNERLELAADASLDVSGNLSCDSGATASVDSTATIITGGNNECAALP